MRPLVVLGMLGTTLDRAQGTARWERWRPTVDLCRHEDLVAAAARTAVRCWRSRPGRERPARIFSMRTGWPVCTESASALRRI